MSDAEERAVEGDSQEGVAETGAGEGVVESATEESSVADDVVEAGTEESSVAGERKHRAHRLSRAAHRREVNRTSHKILHDARKQLGRRLLKLVGCLVFALLIIRIIPGLENAFEDLKNVSLEWVIFALAVETMSEVGYVVSWRGILDPEDLLAGRTRGVDLGARVAWAQLGGGMIVPGGTWRAWASAPGCCTASACRWKTSPSGSSC